MKCIVGLLCGRQTKILTENSFLFVVWDVTTCLIHNTSLQDICSLWDNGLMVCGPLLYLRTINNQNWKYPNHHEDHELISKIGKIADLSEIEFQCTFGHDQHLAAFAMLLFLCRIVARLPAVRQGRSQLAMVWCSSAGASGDCGHWSQERIMWSPISARPVRRVETGALSEKPAATVN